jgi:hypothetical protein
MSDDSIMKGAAQYAVKIKGLVVDFKELLPDLLPQAVDWVEAQGNLVALAGDPLNELGLKIARQVGVEKPEKIRIQLVSDFALPVEQPLRDVVIYTGLLGSNIDGLTLGHSVLIRRGHHRDIGLLSHEFRHVQQYEKYGSIAAFLSDYLWQVAEFGYRKAPLEKDARNHELTEF